MKALLKMRDGSSKDTDLIADKLGDVVTVKVGDLDYKNTQYIDFAYDYSVAKEGDNGYMVIAQGRNCDDNMICEFNGHKDTEYIGKENLLPIYGFKNGDICFVAIRCEKF
jgi:hypothetical protein